MNGPRVPVALTIAGSDSGGGAGVAADLKTFAAMGVHGCLAITAVTAQDTTEITDLFPIPARVVRAQVEAVVRDLAPAAVKLGMLVNREIVREVADAIRAHRLQPVVLDPVLRASTGRELLDRDAIPALRRELLPLVSVLTPNLPEAELLLGRTLRTLESRREGARELTRLGPGAAVITGGHADGVDVLCVDGEVSELRLPWVDGADHHGGGCVFSAAVAAGLACGRTVPDAVRNAKEFTHRALELGLDLGRGAGPVLPGALV
ncbi:MAG: bifunctional hydroxymethylpyrimidine kinase/phosphomethylpyrimidine kinase [Candidatus Dormibacteria bacterium]